MNTTMLTIDPFAKPRQKSDPVLRVRRAWLKAWGILAGDDRGLMLGHMADGRGIATDARALRVHREQEEGFAEVFGEMPRGTSGNLLKAKGNTPEFHGGSLNVNALTKILEQQAEWVEIDLARTEAAEAGSGQTLYRFHTSDGQAIVCNRKVFVRGYRDGERVQAQTNGAERHLRVLDESGVVVGVVMPTRVSPQMVFDWVEVGS